MSLNYKTTSAVQLQEQINYLGTSIVGVELGVWYGTNSGHLLEECANIRKLFGVDPYLPYKDWNREITQEMIDAAKNSAVDIYTRFNNRAELLPTTSQHAATFFTPDSLDFIFVDGDHSYERCVEDLELWYSKIRPGGLFSGHDFSLPGVNKAIFDFRKRNNIKGFFKVIPNDVWYWIKD